MGVQEHRKKAVKHLGVGVLTMSTTRSLNEDESGRWIARQLEKEGHAVMLHRVLPDDARVIAETVLDVIDREKPHVLLLNGGTGTSPKDVTIEAVRPLFQKELTAFGVLFAQLSFEEIDSAAILSRATAGIIRQTAVFCMPGSLKACQLACRELILPELGHLVKHIRQG